MERSQSECERSPSKRPKPSLISSPRDANRTAGMIVASRHDFFDAEEAAATGEHITSICSHFSPYSTVVYCMK